MSTLTADADSLVVDLAALYERTRVREDQITLSRLYWTAHRLREALREPGEGESP